MKFIVEKSFGRDIDKIKDKKLLQKLRDCISQIENAKNLGKIPHVKKIEGYSSFYRIKIGDYRLGMELVSNNEIILIRFLHRKEIYRYFPKKRK
jgi:mRNA interferase RelE/StbE